MWIKSDGDLVNADKLTDIYKSKIIEQGGRSVGSILGIQVGNFETSLLKFESYDDTECNAFLDTIIHVIQEAIIQKQVFLDLDEEKEKIMKAVNGCRHAREKCILRKG